MRKRVRGEKVRETEGIKGEREGLRRRERERERTRKEGQA